MVFAGRYHFTNQISRLLLDHRFDGLYLSTGAHQKVIRQEDVELIHTKSGCHCVTLLTILKVDDQTVVRSFVVDDFTETPTAVQAVITRYHGFELRAVRKQFRILFDESIYGLFIHNNCLSMS